MISSTGLTNGRRERAAVYVYTKKHINVTLHYLILNYICRWYSACT